MQEASNYGFQTARMTTTRRRWPLSLIYVYPAGTHPSEREGSLGVFFFRPFAINNYGDRLLFALTVRVFGQLRFLLFAGLPASPSVYLSKCPTVHGKVNAGPL